MKIFPDYKKTFFRYLERFSKWLARPQGQAIELTLAKHEYFMPKQMFAFFLFTISNNTSICISDFIFDVININLMIFNIRFILVATIVATQH